MVEVHATSTAGLAGRGDAGLGQRREHALVEAQRVLADLQDDRSLGLLRAVDDRLDVLEADDVERRQAVAVGPRPLEQLGGGDERHQGANEARSASGIRSPWAATRSSHSAQIWSTVRVAEVFGSTIAARRTIAGSRSRGRPYRQLADASRRAG